MKLPFKRFIPHTLAFMLMASSPLSVLSTTAYANSLEQVTQQQETLNNINLQEPQNELVEENKKLPPEQEIVTEEQTVPIEPETPLPAVGNAPETTDVENEPSEVTEPTTKPDTSPSETTAQPPVEEEQVDAEQPSQPPMPKTFEDRFQIAKQDMEKVSTYEEKRALVGNAIKEFQKDQQVENMQLAVDYTVLLPYNSKDEFKADKSNYGQTLVTMFEFLPNNSDKEELLFHFADKSIKQTLITLNHNDLRLAEFAHSQLPEGGMKDENRIQLDLAKKKVYEKHSNPESGHINWDDPNIEIGNPPTQDPGQPNWEPGFDPGTYEKPAPIYPMPDDFKEGYSAINYTVENGTCFKTSTQYNQDGSLGKRIKEVATESEKVFCGIEIPDGNSKDLYGDGWDRDFLKDVNGSPDGLANDGESSNKDKPSVILTDTIQYTFEKGLDSPYYHDTGIYVSKENTISYQQARDALYQIAIQSKGKFVEDKGKALALLDGLIILVEDNGKPIMVQDFASLFDDTSIGVKSQGTRSGETHELIDLVEIKEVSSVWINGQEVKLQTSPIVDGDLVLFPIEEIATALHGNVSKSDESTTVEYKGNRITFIDNQSIAKMNEKNQALKTPTRLNTKGVRMVEVKALMDFFGHSVEVNSSTNQVVIKTK